jgi:hypothetical protein
MGYQHMVRAGETRRLPLGLISPTRDKASQRSKWNSVIGIKEKDADRSAVSAAGLATIRFDAKSDTFPMSSPVSTVVTRFAYGLSQLPRVAWYLGQRLALRRLAEVARRREGSQSRARRRPHTDAPVPDREYIMRK